MNPIDIARFWEKVDASPERCWIWKGSKTFEGYGHFKTRQKTHRAHRFSYELHKGKIPNDLVLDHLCKNRLCVNPNHLDAVTNKENILRGNSFSAINAKKTICCRGHPLTPDNLYAKSKVRRCKACAKIQRDEYKLKTIIAQIKPEVKVGWF